MPAGDAGNLVVEPHHDAEWEEELDDKQDPDMMQGEDKFILADALVIN